MFILSISDLWSNITEILKLNYIGLPEFTEIDPDLPEVLILGNAKASKVT